MTFQPLQGEGSTGRAWNCKGHDNGKLWVDHSYTPTENCDEYEAKQPPLECVHDWRIFNERKIPDRYYEPRSGRTVRRWSWYCTKCRVVEPSHP